MSVLRRIFKVFTVDYEIDRTIFLSNYIKRVYVYF